jgi:hypothetical protein
MKKELIVKGPNGTFTGMVIVTSKYIIKRENGESTKVLAYFVESLVNGHQFGVTSANIPDSTVAKIEAVRHEALVQAHLKKLAHTEAASSLRKNLKERGFVEGSKNKVADLKEWIAAHTKPSTAEQRKETAPRAPYVVRRPRLA